MNLNAHTNKATPGIDQSDPTWHPGHAGKSIKKIAVLFTDIIGSTRFFQSHGNLAGRSMLQQHESMATKTITEFGGTAVKNLGDSILAYFVAPQEATKAAIQLQKEFRRYNKKNDTDHQIHVRIGIHFDEGIVEDNDIFGNAVNIASKITNLAESNQIFISHNVFTLVSTIPSLQFEPVALPDQEDVPMESEIYQVLWEKSIDLAPTITPVLYMRPAEKPEDDTPDTLWDNLIEAKTLFWNDKIDEEAITEDQSVILTSKKLSVLMDVATDIFKFIRGYISARSAPPIQVVIDACPSQGIDRLASEGFKPEWEEFRPGAIFLSPSAYRLIEEEGLSIVNAIPPDEDQPQAFYEIAPDDYQQKEDEVLFLHQDAQSRGDHSPCFYCGGKDHIARDCPSKYLTTITGSLTKMGYLSFERIGNKFHTYLASPKEEQRKEVLLQEKYRGEEPSACLGFYELNQISQLRFFKSIWNNRSNDWDTVSAATDKGERTGELIWLAQDCIRVSNLSRAEALLRTCLEKYPDDYRTHCTLAFLNIEKGKPLKGIQALGTALQHAQTGPQQIFILFLLARLHALADDPENALKKIRAIKNIHPYHPEATYQEIKLNFKEGDPDVILKRFVSLIQKNREYYMNALVDPDLAPFSEVIHPKLKKLYTEIRQKAQEKVYEAEREFSSLEQFLVEGDDETKKAGGLMSKIRNLVSTESYFGYLDIKDLADSVISICRGAKARRKEELMDTVQTIDKRLQTIFSLPENFRSQLFPTAAYQKLTTVQSNFKQILEATTFNDFRRFREMSAQSRKILTMLDEIDLELMRVKRILDIKEFFTIFMKNSGFILSVILVTGAIILPTIVYYLNTFFPGFDAFTGSDIRSYHKHTFIFGILGGLAFSFFKSFKTFFSNRV